MSHRVAFSAFLLLLPLACQQPGEPEQAGGVEESVEVAARVGGVAIGVDEVDEFIKEQLFVEHTRNRSPANLFEARKDALEDLVQERILEDEAETRGVSVAELIEQEAEAQGPVTDEEIATFYEENKHRVGDRSLEELSEGIERYLEGQRKQKGVEKLVAAVDFELLLEPPRFEVAASGPSLGPENAPVTIVEFSDFQCPYCERASSVVKEVRERYPDSVRVVYMHFPLETIHPQARGAAEASLCAADQDRFWDYHDKLFENRRELAKDDLLRYATELELDVERFEQCVAERTHMDRVDRDMETATELGVTGTPAFFINGIMISGAKPLESFSALIDAELARVGGAGT